MSQFAAPARAHPAPGRRPRGRPGQSPVRAAATEVRRTANRRHPAVDQLTGWVRVGRSVLYDAMAYVPCDVATVAFGVAASMAQFLLAAGTPGKRYALPHARIMMHQLIAPLTGTASDIMIQAAEYRRLKVQMIELTARHTGRTVEQIERDSDRDRWFTAAEARDYGIVDHVVPSASGVLAVTADASMVGRPLTL